ncbi:MAG TPA: tetratricopeptide repeat protein [Candidatus Nanopelagicales bacterium]|nr:tetratricopeptide repeat protein [Candidatus Nanopelagicales bacterium]
MSKRLLMLEKMTRDGSKDPFHWYALALEYAGQGRHDEALATFQSLREIDGAYVPMYLMCGTMLAKAGRPLEAEEWLTTGIETAQRKGDAHALSELNEALAGLREISQH